MTRTAEIIVVSEEETEQQIIVATDLETEVIEVGIPGAQGAVGFLEIDDDGNPVVVPVGRIDFHGGGFAVTRQSGQTARIDLDLSGVVAGGELGGTLASPTVDAFHSGSTHQSISDAVNAHQIDVVDAHDASAVSFVPTGTLTSADAQSAIIEALTDAKAYTDDGHVLLSVLRGANNGVAALDSTGKVPASELPSLAFGHVFVDADEAAMLAESTAVPGDVSVREDTGDSYILADLPPSTLGNWILLFSGAGAVSSVNTRTGAVTGLEETSNKDAAGGYPSLDGSGYVPDAEINPDIARDSDVSSAISTTEAYADAADAVHTAAADPHPAYETAAEAQALVDVHTAGISDAHDASAVSFIPTGTVAATDVQAAIAEVASEALSGGSLPFASPTISLSATAATGSAASVIHSDATIAAFDATSPTSSAPGDSTSTGVVSKAARRDHGHAREGFGSPSTQAFSDAAATGTATTVPHSDHKHGMPAVPIASAVSVLDAANQYAATDVEAALAEAATGAAMTSTGRYFPERYSGANDSIKVQAAADAAFAAGGLLVLQPAKTYVIPTEVTFKCDVDGKASTFSWTGGSSGVCISCGDGSTTRTQYREMFLPKVVQATPVYTGTDIAVRVWAIQNSTIRFGKISGFSYGVLTIGGATVGSSTGPVQNNQYFFNFINAAWPLRIEGGLSWNNENSYYGGQSQIASGDGTHRNIHIRYTPIPPVTASLQTDSTAGQVDAGLHRYFFTYIDVNGHESGSIDPGVFAYNTAKVTNDSSHTSNSIVVPALSAFNMVGLPDAASINLYRTKADATVLHANLFLVAASLTPSSTYIDTTADASLSASHPAGPNIANGKPESHRFHDINVEGFVADYAVECEGSWCLFQGLRYEQVSGPLFRGAVAYRNTVLGGYGSEVATTSMTETLGAHDNVVIPQGGAGPANRAAFTQASSVSATDVQTAIQQLATQMSTPLGNSNQETLTGVSLATGSAAANPVTTSSVAPTTSVVFVVVASNLTVTGAPTITGITGLGGTWSQVGTVAGMVANSQRVSLWIGTGCSGSGTLSIAQSGTPSQGRYSIVEVLGIDTASPYVVGSVKTKAPGATATSSYVTPNGMARTQNAILVATHHGQVEDITPLNGATELNDTSAANASGVETNILAPWVSGAVGGSWATTTIQYMSIAVEIQAPYRGTFLSTTKWGAD